MTGRVRGIELLRAGWGAALLLAPRTVLGHVHHVEVDRRGVAVARVLGGRQLGQAVLSGVDPSPELLAMGVWVDTAHAMTAAGLAAVDRSRARAGITDTLVAAGWALLGYRDLSQAHRVRPGHDQVRDRLARWVLGWVPLGARLRSRAEQASLRPSEASRPEH